MNQNMYNDLFLSIEEKCETLINDNLLQLDFLMETYTALLRFYTNITDNDIPREKNLNSFIHLLKIIPLLCIVDDDYLVFMNDVLDICIRTTSRNRTTPSYKRALSQIKKHSSNISLVEFTDRATETYQIIEETIRTFSDNNVLQCTLRGKIAPNKNYYPMMVYMPTATCKRCQPQVHLFTLLLSDVNPITWMLLLTLISSSCNLLQMRRKLKKHELILLKMLKEGLKKYISKTLNLGSSMSDYNLFVPLQMLATSCLMFCYEYSEDLIGLSRDEEELLQEYNKMLLQNVEQYTIQTDDNNNVGEPKKYSIIAIFAKLNIYLNIELKEVFHLMICNFVWNYLSIKTKEKINLNRNRSEDQNHVVSKNMVEMSAKLILVFNILFKPIANFQINFSQLCSCYGEVMNFLELPHKIMSLFTQQHLLPLTINTATDVRLAANIFENFANAFKDINVSRDYHKLANDLFEEKKRSMFPIYSNFTRPKGIALIINNYNFGGPNAPADRKGSLNDVYRMKTLLNSIGYWVYKKSNLSATKMKIVIKKFARKFQQLSTHNDPTKRRKLDSCIVVIMTHGDEDKNTRDDILIGRDKRTIRVKDVISLLNSENNKALQGKPKFLIVNACRGEAKGSVSMMKDSFRTNFSTVGGPIIKSSVNADIFVLYSTAPGCYSYITLEGSLFIQKFCEIFERYGAMYHVRELIQLVIRDVPAIPGEESQMPHCGDSAHKNWYLFPTVFNPS